MMLVDCRSPSNAPVAGFLNSCQNPSESCPIRRSPLASRWLDSVERQWIGLHGECMLERQQNPGRSSGVATNARWQYHAETDHCSGSIEHADRFDPPDE